MIGVTAEGEQLLGYGRRMIAMNDEIFSQMTDQAYEGAGSGGPT
jgi:DNA-binding transcriptional LysR family regulator